MSTALRVDVNQWSRKDIYHHYKDYDDPFFSICTQLNVSRFVQYTKARRYPFSLCLVYLSLYQANLHDSFRFRIIDEQVKLIDQAHAVMTVLHDNDCFDYCYFEYQRDFFEFLSSASGELENHRRNTQPFCQLDNEYDIIHYTMLPWINFSNMRHAHDYKRVDSVPKFVFGKYADVHGELMMPMSIEVNHALMDGIHVARFLNDFQQALDQPEAAMMMMSPINDSQLAHA